MIKEALQKITFFRSYVKDLNIGIDIKKLPLAQFAQLYFKKIIKTLRASRKIFTSSAVRNLPFKQTLKKNKKEIFSGLLLFTIFLVTSFALYPHTHSKANNKVIATSKLPQKEPSAIPTPTPKVTRSHKKQYNKNNLIIYYPPSISPTTTPPANSSTSGIQTTSGNNASSVTTPTPLPTIDNQKPNNSTASPTPTITPGQNSNQTKAENTHADTQATPIQQGGNTEEPIVGTVINTGKAITSNLLQANQ